MGDILIYGATGYTGRLIAEHAVAHGIRPILAGRNGTAVRSLAEQLALPHRAFDLEHPSTVQKSLGGVGVVVHAAGPFSATSRPMAEACLAAGAHYCDITGEIDVFETLAAQDARAKAAGIVVLPGSGFDVVPSDCLAAHAAARLPDATHLRLTIGGVTNPSRGTAKTMVEAVAQGVSVRTGNRIVRAAGTPRGEADFGGGSRPTIGVSWGDVATAWYTTHIPNIEVFFEADRNMEVAARLPNVVKRILGTAILQRVLKAQIDRRLPPGPTAEQRARGHALVVATVRNAAGVTRTSRLTTPEPYALTARTAVEVARRLAAGEVAAGFRTPGAAFGADFILGFEGVGRVDL